MQKKVCMHMCMYALMDGWLDERTDGRTDGGMDGWMMRIRVYVCTCTHARICGDACKLPYMPTYIHTYIHHSGAHAYIALDCLALKPCVRTDVHARMHTHIHAYLHACCMHALFLFVFLSLCLRAETCMYIYILIIYVYTHMTTYYRCECVTRYVSIRVCACEV